MITIGGLVGALSGAVLLLKGVEWIIKLKTGGMK